METDLNQAKVLIVDDNPKNLQVLGTSLRSENYSVEFATNGETAMNWIKEDDFDIILLDVMMPDQDGFEVCKKIREEIDSETLPIIFLTARSDEESTINGFKVGAQDYVTKPFSSPELLARVKTQIELKRSRAKLASINQYLEEQVQARTHELKKANEELQKLDDVKTDFLNMLSHEIRTPLNGILGPLQLIKSRTDSEEFLDLLQMLDESVERLESFSYTALLITRLKSKKYRFERQRVEVLNLLSLISVRYDKQLKQKKIEFNCSGVEQGLSIQADIELVNDLLTRIIDNSINFSAEGGCIQISSAQEENNTMLTVRDFGSGFPDKILGKKIKLFNPGQKHVAKDIGLSLYLCHLIMEAHNSELVFENHPEGGAVVKLVFKGE